jgi:hypothetical protein
MIAVAVSALLAFVAWVMLVATLARRRRVRRGAAMLAALAVPVLVCVALGGLFTEVSFSAHVMSPIFSLWGRPRLEAKLAELLSPENLLRLTDGAQATGAFSPAELGEIVSAQIVRNSTVGPYLCISARSYVLRCRVGPLRRIFALLGKDAATRLKGALIVVSQRPPPAGVHAPAPGPDARP